MISILVNSHRPDMAEATRAMYAKLLADRSYELIVISDARSMCEGYSRAMKVARGDVIVFAHHDLEYLFDDFAAVLERSITQYDVIGVAGTDELVHPIWTAAGIGRLFGQIVHPGVQGGFDVEVYGAPGPSVGGDGGNGRPFLGRAPRSGASRRLGRGIVWRLGFLRH
jgi:Glycosyltransferase like family